MKKYLFALLAGVVLSSVGAVRAQEVTNPNHTVVRFEVSTGGQPFGSLDIELFDQEKPETVKNFLRYVYRGVYSNLVLHRVVTNFVLQAGYMTITNPASTESFSAYTPGANYGSIVNEYSVGPELSNEFGTIAMARIGGQPNSASAQWFFNLTNNPFLDTVDGGFTVFGRVVNTTNAFTGTNLLNYFNSVSVRTAIVSRASGPTETNKELPVSASPLSSPRYADLFTVQAKIIQGPQLPAPQHSVVRFNIFTGGTNFGNIDIELFDQEKPETVKNFLLYVYSGVYSNLVMHRLVPGFVLQAGHVRLADPNTNIAFSTYIPGVNWGAITNEYGVGPELGNDYGTIAMARVPGDTNSASGDFFFNLTNNATLNTNDGGFTVFGRVVNSYDARSGTNLLNYFSSFSQGQGLSSVFIFDYFDFLSELAVSVNRSTVLVPDLFTVRSAVIQGVTERDTSAPTLTVIEPAALPAIHRTTNATYHFSGTAADNQGLSRVLVDAASGQRFVLDGTTNWTFDARLNPGTNEITVRAVDAFGNLSTEKRVVFYSVPLPVTLQVEGKGKTTGITNGQIMEVGVTYPLTAAPAKGYYFLGWSGNVLNTRAQNVSFTMQSNAAVICRYSRNLLGLTPGRYEGVFAPSNNGLRKSEGQITLTLRANGSYSGRLKPFGANYGIRGRFDTNGQTVIYGTLGTNVLALGMGLYSEGQEKIGGQYTDGTFLSDFVLWRQQVYGKTNFSPYAGNYTFTLSPPTATNNPVTDGSGFGTATVDSKGRITWTGVLADGFALKAKANELKGGAWSFYYPTKTGEALAGEAKFTTNGTFSGNVKWFSAAFPDQTNQSVKLTGARYIPPVSGRPFDWTNGVLTISGGGLSQPIVSGVELQPDGSFLISSNPHNIQITVTNVTGLVGGTFLHPGSNTLTRLRGAVLQSSNSAAGFVPVLPRSAGFELRRAP